MTVIRRWRRGFAPGLLCLAALLLASCRAGYRVEGEVRDAAGGGPVYDARVSYAGRSTRLFTQKSFSLRYDGRPQGLLRVSAPGYVAVELQPRLRRHRARVQISLQGREVPGWHGILAWATRRGNGLLVEIQLLDAQGVAIEHFPGLAWSAQARIWENVGSESKPVRGRLLYEGSPAVTSNPESKLRKLRAAIPVERIARSGTKLGVLEFVLQAQQRQFSWTRGDVPLVEGVEP
jgi:hypothetical protein